MITESLSKKLRFFSFLLIVLVVLVHSQNISNRIPGFEPNQFNLFIQGFISGGIASVAVPLFFIISGMLFFKGRNNLSMPEFKEKITKRVRTLVIPYLLVSLLAIAFFFVLQIPESAARFFNNKHIADYSALEILDAWLVNPLAYQLWYLRNLILVCLISPLIYKLVKLLGLVYIIPVILIYIFLSDFIPLGLLMSLAFFSLGVYFSIRKMDMLSFRTSIWSTVILCLLWFVLIFVSLSYPEFKSVGMKISVLFGIVALWLLYDHFEGILERTVALDIFKYSFFIYLFHEPMTTMFIKIIFAVFGKTNIVSSCAYVFVPIIVITTCYVGGRCLRKILSPVYNVLTGSR